MTERKPWSFAAGQKARPHRVTVFENVQRDGVLSLRWFVESTAGRKPRHESLGRKLRTADGKIVREIERWAKAQAQAKHEALARGEAETHAAAAAPLTIGEAKAKITDATRGRYPTKSQHRRETEAALDFAVTVWGAHRAWDTIRKGDLRALGRARIDQLRARKHDGLAGAEHTVQRILTVAQWLRDEELVEPGACLPGSHWKEELRTYWLETSARHELPAPKRPHYTREEAFKILAAAPSIDPRLDLMLWLAPNQRLGQVARVRRSNVDLKQNAVKVPTRGKKKGAGISMTRDELQALTDALTTGYLRELEAAYQAGTLADYPLFPSGQLGGGRVLRRGFASEAKYPSWRPPDRPTALVERHATATTVSRKTIGDWFLLAEAKAKVAHVDGRGPYGIRRMYTNEAKRLRISREGLTSLGGWSDPQMADRVYAEDDAQYARDEARDVRATIRGERPTTPTTPPGEMPTNVQQTHNSASGTEGAVDHPNA